LNLRTKTKRARRRSAPETPFTAHKSHWHFNPSTGCN